MVGYDPINEPMPAWEGLIEMIDMLKPGNFDMKELQPFYAKIYERY